MIVKLHFDPAVDNFDSVLSAVVGAFGMTDSAVMAPSPKHDNVAAAQNFADGVESNGQQFAPSPEAAAAALAIAQQQNAQQGHSHTPATVDAGTHTHSLSSQQPASETSGTLVIGELDKDGLPWDERIHADGKDRKTRAGYWKKKRGVADDLVKKVIEELRGKMAAASNIQVDGAASIPAGGVLGGIQTDNGAPSSTPAAQPQVPASQGPNTPPAPNTPPSVNVDSASSFAALMAYAMRHMNSPANPAGVLTAEHLTDTAKQLSLIDPRSGVPELRLLDQRPDLLGLAKQWIDHYIANPAHLGPQKSGLPGQ